MVRVVTNISTHTHTLLLEWNNKTRSPDIVIWAIINKKILSSESKRFLPLLIPADLQFSQFKNINIGLHHKDPASLQYKRQDILEKILKNVFCTPVFMGFRRALCHGVSCNTHRLQLLNSPSTNDSTRHSERLWRIDSPRLFIYCRIPLSSFRHIRPQMICIITMKDEFERYLAFILSCKIKPVFYWFWLEMTLLFNKRPLQGW